MGRPGENNKAHRNYKKEYQNRYKEHPEKLKDHQMEQQARRDYEKEHGNLPSKVEVDHKRPVSAGGGNAKSNLRAIPQERNAGWRKGQKGYKVGKI